MLECSSDQKSFAVQMWKCGGGGGGGERLNSGAYFRVKYLKMNGERN